MKTMPLCHSQADRDLPHGAAEGGGGEPRGGDRHADGRQQCNHQGGGTQTVPGHAHYWVTWGPVHSCPRLHIACSRLGLLLGRKVQWEETQVRLLEAVEGHGGALEGDRR